MPRGYNGKVGRPNVEVPTDRVVELRDAGHSWRAIAKALGQAVTTIRRAYHQRKSGHDPYQNSGGANQ